MSNDICLTDVRDGVGVVTMNRPDARNALNAELLAAVPAVLAELDGRDDVAAIVLTGADPAFCAGLDLKGLSSAEGLQSAVTPPKGQDGPFPPLRKPLIGAINGAAVTGGFDYTLACDFLIASEKARFADTHARVGIMPGWGLSLMLPQAVGYRRARQMSFTGNFLDAPTALAWGLVNEVVPHDDLLAWATELGRDIASIDTANVQEIRELYTVTSHVTLGDAWPLERRRSDEWMDKEFDPAVLADSRESIQARGRSQV